MLWKHECTRVFADRFNMVEDHAWFENTIARYAPMSLHDALMSLHDALMSLYEQYEEENSFSNQEGGSV